MTNNHYQAVDGIELFPFIKNAETPAWCTSTQKNSSKDCNKVDEILVTDYSIANLKPSRYNA
eukprot:c35059_g1_i1 orf=55-240(+)